MTRRKQRHQERELAAFRQARIDKLLRRGLIRSAAEIPSIAIPVDHDLMWLGNTWCPPLFYADQLFFCQDCRAPQVWKAQDQLWYYETVRGFWLQTAVRCLPCRRAHRARKELSRRPAA